MLNKLFTFIFLFSCSSLPAQVNIGIEENNVIYRGLPNPISVACGNKDSIYITEKSAALEVKNDNGKLYLNCLNVKEDTAFIVFRIQNSTLQRKFIFPVADVPQPVIRFGAIDVINREVSRTALMPQTLLVALLENFIYDGVKCSVTSYQMRYLDPVYQDFKTIEVKGASLAPIKPALAKLKAGDRFELKHIQIMTPGNKIITHPDILISLN